MTPTELAGQIAIELIRKSGVREYENDAACTAIGRAASLIVCEIFEQFGDFEMTVLGTFKDSEGTAKVIRNSGGDAAITLASLANGNGTSAGGRQAVTLDLGAKRARRYRLECNFELAATPTAGNAINLFGSWASVTGAGEGNTSGSDAAYTGYSNNIDAATKQLEFLGSHLCTAQATSTQQRSIVGTIYPKGQFLNLVVDNRCGAAFHNTETNQFITLTPIEETIEN